MIKIRKLWFRSFEHSCFLFIEKNAIILKPKIKVAVIFSLYPPALKVVEEAKKTSL